MRDTFRAFVDNGVPFTIATDGPEMMRTHLRDEFELLLRIGALDEDELQAANERGHEASFVGAASPPSPRRSTDTPFGEWSRPAVRPSLARMQALRDPSGITSRQRQVVELIAQGLSNDEVGARARHLAADGEGALRRPAPEARRPTTAADPGRVPTADG